MHLALLFLGIFILLLVTEVIRRTLHWPQEVTRKIVHITVGLLMVFTPLLLETSLPLLVISAFFTGFNYVAIRRNLFPGIHIDRKNFGTVYYALAFFVLVLFFWENHKLIIITSVLLMAVGDAAAAIAGQTIRRPHNYILIQDQKSLEGSAVMLIMSWLLVSLLLFFHPYSDEAVSLSLSQILLGGFLTALLATAAEALGHRGNDNILVPLISAVVLFYIFSAGNSQLIQLLVGMILGALIAFISFRVHFLTASGAMATFILAAFIFGFGGWKWTLPILTFFILSSLLSRTGQKTKSRYNLIFEKGHRRDHGQVFANGGIAVLLITAYVFTSHADIYFLYLGALAAAMADTWATETGVLFGRNPRLIYNFKPVEIGTSGGVTLAGTLGAFSGSLVLGMSGIFQANPRPHLGFIFLIIVLSGLLASFVDSFWGAALQGQYYCHSCGKITEKKIHCDGKPTALISGLRWINNDVVNFVNTWSGGLFVFLGLQFLKWF
ncbi:MAG: DUF92 domain-containing protein [Calditrichia bacterium]